MGRNPKKSNDNLPRTSPLYSLKRILVFIGRPLFYAILATLVASLIILFVTGRLLRIILIWFALAFYELLFSIVKTSAVWLVVTRRRVVTGLPTIRLPSLRNALTLLKLKLSLKFLQTGKKIRFPILSVSKKGIIPAILISLTLILAFGFWVYILHDLPSPQDLVTRDQEVSTKIYDANGILLYKIFKDKNRSIVALSDIPMHVRLATLAAEDAEFYDHPGFSIRGITRALQRNITRGELAGGSTITQQLVKNALLSSEKTIIRKLREIVLAIKVENAFSKDEILEMYLNEVSYGGTAYGIQEAAELYFGKDVDQLNLSEAALLAGLPKSPTKFSPFGPSPELGVARAQDVLDLMIINRFATADEIERAGGQAIALAPNKTEILAPHFVFYVRQLLEDKYGREVVEKGGLEVITSLDYSIQRLAERIVEDEVDSLVGLNVGNGAAIVTNPATGEILAMVGSKNYFDQDADGNVNVTTAVRNPGSSIKLINYAYALENGYFWMSRNCQH